MVVGSDVKPQTVVPGEIAFKMSDSLNATADRGKELLSGYPKVQVVHPLCALALIENTINNVKIAHELKCFINVFNG
jgi:hypothetical protein